MADLTFIFAGNSSFYNNLEARYFAPKEEFDVAKEVPNYSNMSVKDLTGLVKNKGVRDKTFWDEEGTVFYGKDGATDAYTKSGEDYELAEYFDRQFIEQRVWRFETNATHIDFKSGGIVKLGDGKEWVILSIIYSTNTGTVPNMFYANNNPHLRKRLAVKTLILG